MLYIRTTELTAKPIEWKLGDPAEPIHDVADANKIQYLKATDAELEFIRDCGFKTIRSSSGCNTWYGEDARFIAGNL